MSVPARKIETFDEYDVLLEEGIILDSLTPDPAGVIDAWHTVTPRTSGGGRVPKAPTSDEAFELCHRGAR
jgi:hypothetical protein